MKFKQKLIAIIKFNYPYKMREIIMIFERITFKIIKMN